MEKIREYLKNPLITAAAGFVVGLIIGWMVLGWGLFPVKWTDASAGQLRADVREDYLKMAIQSYSLNKDATLALTRWNELGDAAPEVFKKVQLDPSMNAEAVALFSNVVQAPMQEPLPAVPGEGVTQAVPLPLETQVVPATEEKEGGIKPVLLLGVFCLLTLIIGGAAAYVLLIRKRPARSGASYAPVQQSQEINRTTEVTDYESEGQSAPIQQFMTTYMLGDDLYDDSFSIDSTSGEFLGECGVGITETIGVGDPKKVTAFEVWLFDKTDIQTVTKVLMSEHAFNDPSINQKLASKGDPVMIAPGERVLLETAALQLEARVVDMNYGQGALPENSFFDRLTLELAIWPKGSRG
ncbi:hypothetical protein ADN00_08280 [Ornatilinea apprima]|uniref:Uncharacterized protein n=1 Tax=Ornatilinea apprima TaxID=1134406 RepID=A0A0P6X7E3_9CHLR|nr:hypothetical protein [Ornatilinea apprima]KPL77865.1 hypothetical protein ADN00_08280 [Ornatilinea apprima]